MKNLLLPSLCRTGLVYVVFLLNCLPSWSALGPEADMPRYTIDARRNGVSIGTMTIELYPLAAPKAVRYFDSLVSIHFYDTTAFHRVIPGFVIQGGDPNSRHGAKSSWGMGDAGQATVEAEFTPIPYLRSTLGAARSTDTNSATSQFFISVVPTPNLNGKYTVYGHVVSGMNIADTIVNAPRDLSDNPLQKIEMFVTRSGQNAEVPEAPLATLPGIDSVNIGSGLTFACSTVNNAVLYQFEVARDSQFTESVTRVLSGTTTAPISGLETGLVDYYWHVRAANGGHWSAFSATRKFTTAISQVQLISPETGSTNQSIEPQLHWSPVKGATAYHLTVATSSLFIPSSIILNKNDIHDTTYRLSSLLESKRYMWRVAAISDKYEGQYSQTFNFTTGQKTEVEEKFEPSSFSISPQPVSSLMRIHVGPSSTPIKLSIRSLIGTTIWQHELEAANWGGTIDIDASSMPSGIVTVECQFEGRLLSKTCLISHN